MVSGPNPNNRRHDTLQRAITKRAMTPKGRITSRVGLPEDSKRRGSQGKTNPGHVITDQDRHPPKQSPSQSPSVGGGVSIGKGEQRGGRLRRGLPTDSNGMTSLELGRMTNLKKRTAQGGRTKQERQRIQRTRGDLQSTGFWDRQRMKKRSGLPYRHGPQTKGGPVGASMEGDTSVTDKRRNKMNRPINKPRPKQNRPSTTPTPTGEFRGRRQRQRHGGEGGGHS